MVFSSFWFIFALLSGSEQFGGGLKGILMNSPNAIPWLLLFGFVYVAWRWELIGGILISIMGLLTIFAFDTYEDAISFLIISLPMVLLGSSLITCWYLTRHKK